MRIIRRKNHVQRSEASSFDISKIADAIKKAFDATNTDYTESVIDFLALKVTADFLPKIKDGLITVEDIQDSAEAVLSRAGYEAVGKAYILYRKQREKMRNLKWVRPIFSTANSARKCVTSRTLIWTTRKPSTSI